MKHYFHNYDIALLCGVGLTLSRAPFYFFPFLILSIVILYLLLATERTKSAKEAFLVSWWFGFAYFSTSLYWLAFPPLIDAAQFAWLIPFAVFGLAALFALYFGIGSVIFYQLKQYNKLSNALIFAIIFTCIEWVVGHAFTGFPWNVLGYAWVFSNEIMQITSVIGIYGLTFITFLLISVIADFVVKNSNYLALTFSIFITIGTYMWGMYRLDDNVTEYVEDTTLRLVQANITQKISVNYKQANDTLKKYIELSAKSGIDKISYIVWPESAVNFRVDDDLLDIIKSKIKARVIFGASRTEGNSVFNSMYVNSTALYYDKRHLVPFGEYVPLRKILPINKIVPGSQDISSNRNHNRNITVPGLPTFAPSICYEAIFPNEVVNRNEDMKAKWMLNITNDSWFGVSLEPYQHMDMAKVRAIEEGIPLVRVANAGISAVIDSYGRVIAALPLRQEGIIDVRLPKHAANPTIYSKIADYIDWIILVITILIVLNVVYYAIRNKVKCYGR